VNSIITLGKFERVALKDAWPTEDGNFTPWLAEPNNMASLAAELNLELEVLAVEHRVGSFRADILAKAVEENDHKVIIENQFGLTDHGHLGQILTYLAGVEGAQTIVWIAESIRPDHRAAVDWLNSNTLEDYSFFAIEIELWRIGASPPAPRFNVVVSPNDWTRATRKAARQAADPALGGRHLARLQYWASFGEFLRGKEASFHLRTPTKDPWKWFAIGRSGFGINAIISSEKKRIGVELYISDDLGKAAFTALHAQREAIDAEFGEPLDWQILTGKKASKIVVYKTEVDPTDESQYPALHAWMLEKMNKFRHCFAARVKALPVGVALGPEDGEAPEE
jgi:hypothetical protein